MAVCYNSCMDQLFTYLGYAYVACGGLLLAVEGLKKIAALNGAEGPEDRALSKAEAALHIASDFLAKFGPDLRKKA